MIYSQNMKRITDFLDSLDFPPLSIVWILGMLTVIRLFFESFSNPEPTGLFSPIVILLNYWILYGMLMMFFSFALGFLTKKSLLWSVRVATLVFPLVIFTPLIDLLFSGGSGYCIGFVQQGSHSILGLIPNFLLPHEQLCGITPGLRVQIITSIIGLAGLVFLITKNWWRAILGGIAAYLITFFGGALPVIINVFTKTVSNPTFTDSAQNSLISSIHYPTSTLPFTPSLLTITSQLLTRVEIIIVIISIGIIWYYSSKHSWTAWWKGFAAKLPVAGMHFILMIFGLSLGASVIPTHLIWADWLGILMIILAWTFACSGLGAVNDSHDVAIDNISNRKWWLIEPGLAVSHLETIRIFAFIFAIACAYLVNYNALYCLLVFISGYILHASQLRLKRFWGTASFTIALSGAATFLAGFFTLSGDQVVGHLPLSIVAMVAFLLLPYSVIKDVPDITGDKAHGIRTFAAMYGPRKAIILVLALIAGWFTLFFSIIPWFFALGVIITILTFVIRPRWIYDKALLFGVPSITCSILLFIHIVFF